MRRLPIELRRCAKSVTRLLLTARASSVSRMRFQQAVTGRPPPLRNSIRDTGELLAGVSSSLNGLAAANETLRVGYRLFRQRLHELI